jgi:hypothetical protein
MSKKFSVVLLGSNYYVQNNTTKGFVSRYKTKKQAVRMLRFYEKGKAHSKVGLFGTDYAPRNYKKHVFSVLSPNSILKELFSYSDFTSWYNNNKGLFAALKRFDIDPEDFFDRRGYVRD